MIDISKLKTMECKVLAFIINSDSPVQKYQIVSMTGISRRGLLNVLESLMSAGLIIQDTNFNVKTYRYAGSTVPTMGSVVPSIGSTVPATGEKQPTTLTLVNQTEPNLTNGDFNLENSVNSRQTAEGRQQQSENCCLTTEDYEVKPRQRRSHFASAAISRQPVEKTDYRFSIQERLSQSRGSQFSEGTIFVSGDPPWMYLYRMLADLGIDEISHPAAPLVKVPAYNVFVDSLPRFYGMFHRKPVKDKPVYDTVLHCLAYLHAKKHTDFADAAAVNDTFRIFQQEKKNAKGRIELWTPVLQAMQSIFDEEYYGWNPSLNQYRDFWSTEVKFAREHGFEPRKDLFYSYFTKLKLMTADNRNQTADVR